ncbi:MAG TPA: hypothetical protein VF188_12625 [Longimicrobiales bacterium]
MRYSSSTAHAAHSHAVAHERAPRGVRLPSITGALVATVLCAACGAHLFDHWRGRPVLTRATAVPADRLWDRLARRAGALDLVLTAVQPDRRLIEFDWITAPGDGRIYLRCTPAGPIGSASLRPRVMVRPSPTGSVVIIATEVRATTSATCESTGQFEDWLFGRLEPAIAEAAASSDAGAVTDRPD